MTGFIDSGAGGFSALRAFRRRFPLENVCYFADSLHLPYGEKSPEELTRYTLFACSFLFARGADRIVFACGTASALALPALSGLFPFLYGVTEPAAKAAAKATVNGKIGILATKGTVRARGYEVFLPDCETVSLAAPDLVPLAERGTPPTQREAEEVFRLLSPFRESSVDTLILGCTHFSLLSDVIGRALPGVTLIHAGEEAVNTLPPLPPEEGQVRLFATACPEAYRLAFRRATGEDVTANLAVFPPLWEILKS